LPLEIAYPKVYMIIKCIPQIRWKLQLTYDIIIYLSILGKLTAAFTHSSIDLCLISKWIRTLQWIVACSGSIIDNWLGGDLQKWPLHHYRFRVYKYTRQNKQLHNAPSAPVAQWIEQWIPNPKSSKLESQWFQVIIWFHWLFLCPTSWEILGFFRENEARRAQF
jgi:hypothetical protein